MSKFIVKCVFSSGTSVNLGLPAISEHRAIEKAKRFKFSYGIKPIGFLVYDRKSSLVRHVEVNR